MTADQMPELKDMLDFLEVEHHASWCGFHHGERCIYRCADTVKAIRSYIQDLSTPPKSQGVDVAGAVSKIIDVAAHLVQGAEIPSHAKEDHAREVPKWMLRKIEQAHYDLKLQANKLKQAADIIQAATRQHPTPAQAQGESVTVEELVNPIGTAYRTAGNLDAKDWTHVFVSTLQALGYTIIKRTE